MPDVAGRLDDAGSATSGLLVVHDVSVRFGGIVALDGVSFDVTAGQIAGLIGPNGAGKTTLFNCLSRLYECASGSITFDAIGKMRTLVPTARLYAWRDKADPFSDGRVHAKVAVTDGMMCFITSANLTGYAMEKNMEAGVLISGGNIPRLLDDHLRSLVDTKVVSPV